MISCGCRGAKCRLPENDQRHGTDNGYKNLGCRCPECEVAHGKACKSYKEARLARGIPEWMHGFVNTYVNYDCRCPPCTLSHAGGRSKYRKKSAA